MPQSRIASVGAAGLDEAAARLEAVVDDLHLMSPVLQRPHQQRAGHGVVVGSENVHEDRGPGISGVGASAWPRAGGGAGRYSISTPLTTA